MTTEKTPTGRSAFFILFLRRRTKRKLNGEREIPAEVAPNGASAIEDRKEGGPVWNFMDTMYTMPGEM